MQVVDCYNLTRQRGWLQHLTEQVVTAFDITKTYSRTSIAGTLMARLPRLFRTHSCVARKNPWAVELGYFRVIFFFILQMVNCVYSLESPQ